MKTETLTAQDQENILKTIKPIIVNNFAPKHGEEYFYQSYCDELKLNKKDNSDTLTRIIAKVTGLQEWLDNRQYATFYNNDRFLFCYWQYKNCKTTDEKIFWKKMIEIFDKSFRGVEGHPYRGVFTKLVHKMLTE